MRMIKKLIAIFATIVILTVVCAADGIETNTFYYENGKEITVFNENLSYHEKKEIADYIAYNSNSFHLLEPCYSVESSILCTLFGHNLETTYVSETNHNVYTESPRCVRNTYACEYCTRSSCDYIETTLISSFRISSCHG